MAVNLLFEAVVNWHTTVVRQITGLIWQTVKRVVKQWQITGMIWSPKNREAHGEAINDGTLVQLYWAVESPSKDSYLKSMETIREQKY